MESKVDFKNIIQKFNFEGKFIKAEPYGFGHINATFVVYFEKENGSTHRYILQKINTNIFKSPEKLMENIEKVTAHIKNKLIANGGNPARETMEIIRTKDGRNLYISESGDCWRGYVFIENAQTYQLVENPIHFYNSGKAFGKFQQNLYDFPAEELYETIPDFHDTEKRYMAFLDAVTNDVKGRVKEVTEEIRFIMDRSEDTKVLVNLLKENKLPLRVTHNDTKFNNVMIDDLTGEGICVIDLDTVMPGLSLYDFGDSIRSGATTAEEDEADLSKVWLDLELFESFTRGFIEAAGKSLTNMEIKYLSFSAKLLTFECGIRFLTDYLNGDVYFRIHREKHNLDRARNQFKLVADMEEKFQQMKSIVKEICQ
ncbi:aminoglycoside phosphotransferase family protein [Clostridium sp. YIM B02515]|uniref:Aminoglycoside phosphotransferase family protein n=1 Tax=Clostridium rhizosphaerae TaxID=2803861 RepID=A0ABS1TCQ5_9CLOT|nr:aminoglycoside phosphotransferase family protein [Clostridium rhizosphaerae]MBL4937143.1 aminoglycoside phosphotransferase family protein [Clostridium rhizosphaerae]